jgi:hypothetical protein
MFVSSYGFRVTEYNAENLLLPLGFLMLSFRLEDDMDSSFSLVKSVIQF